jgi:predicted metal-dependent peptidase
MSGTSEAYKQMQRARAGLVLKHPFFASLALRLRMREDVTCQTAWTDGRVLAYNPHYVSMLPTEKLEGLTAHLVMHPACGHHRRRQGREARTWNRACDYVINWILLDAGLTLPDGHLYLDQYRGETAESVYARLRAEAGEADSEPGAEPVDQAEEEQQPPNQEHRDGDGEGGRQDEETEEEDAPTDPGMAGEVRDDPGEPNPGEPSGTETDWEQALIQAALNARAAGRLPAGLERLVAEMISPRLCWRELLRRFIMRSARSDYSWLRPNKRYLGHNLYLPSLNNHELGEIVIAVDTSGSIRDSELRRFSAEVGAILEQCPATVHLLYCDMRICRQELFQRHDPPILPRLGGGGGTDYRPVFARVGGMGCSPECLIYLTDMECDLFPESAPPYPVLWVRVGDKDSRPPFGEVVRLREPVDAPSLP